MGALTGPLVAQTTTSNSDKIIRDLEKLNRNPLVRQLLQRGKKAGLSAAQKKILQKAVDSMTDKQVIQFLKENKLSVEGSEFRRRERLKLYLGLKDTPTLPAKRSIPRIAIENAAEGEFMQGGKDERGILKLRGRIRIKLPNGTITADRVIVDTGRKEMYAEGNLLFVGTNGSKVKAERIIYNQELGIGIMYNASGYFKPVHFIGKNLIGTGRKRFAVSHVHFTTCAAERPHYNFSARKIWIEQGKSILAVGVLYHVGGVPLLPLPFFYANNWGTGVISQFGYGRLQGYFLQNTYQFSNPKAALSSWQPMMYRFTADWYEKVGESYGAEFYKFAPNVNYVVHLGAARYKRTELIADFREADALRVTNQIYQEEDYTLSKEEYKWYKIFSIFNIKYADAQTNNVRNIYLRYESYSHQEYELQFGSRYQPTSTIPALYANSEAGRGLLRSTTNWNLIYDEKWDDLSLRVEATRNRFWKVETKFEDGRFIPINDVVPQVDIKKNFLIGHLGEAKAPVYWEHTIHTDVQKQYSSVTKSYSYGENPDGFGLFQTLTTNRYETNFRSVFSFFPYITFEPVVGYGAQKTVLSDSADDALERETQKRSYQYFRAQPEFVIGPDFLFLRLTHFYKESFKEEVADAPTYNPTGYENDQKVNETEVSLEAYPLRNLKFSVTSAYDHRDFQFDVGYRERWYYPVARLDYTIDFLNFGRPARENLLSRRKLHFVQLRVTDDYVYDSINAQDHSNVLGLNLQVGGFDLPLLKRLRYIELGYYWYHVYYNQELDHMRLSLKFDLQLTKYIYWELELESRATDIERYSSDSTDDDGYSDHVKFTKDIVNSIGWNGAQRKQNSVFNIGFMETALILDLHEWEMRVGYSIEQKSIFAGYNSLEVVNFYDNKVFFSFTLLRSDIGSVSERPSRFTMDRRKVRSSELGRSGVTSSRL